MIYKIERYVDDEGEAVEMRIPNDPTGSTVYAIDVPFFEVDPNSGQIYPITLKRSVEGATSIDDAFAKTPALRERHDGDVKKALEQYKNRVVVPRAAAANQLKLVTP